MEFLQVGPQRHWTQPMNPFCFRLGTKLPITRLHLRSLFRSCSISASLTPGSAEVAVLESQGSENAVVRKESSGVDGSRKGRVRVKFTNAQLKQNWIDSLSCPSMVDGGSVGCESAGLDWVLGIDPDTCGAVALLKPDVSDYTAQVFDSPSIPVVVGKRVRKRLDPKSILQLLQSLDAPAGTKAYIEQSLPFPQDGKQGWWSAGYGYGLWIGSLLASGFSVIPVPSKLWKNGFELSGSRSSKDDSRLLASKMFPTLSAQLRRKKDHGRAEALLIAAYGKGLKVDSDLLPISKD